MKPRHDPLDHVHRWRIGEPNGPISRGSCRECGAERDFSNVHPSDRGGQASAWDATGKRWLGRAAS